LWTESDDKGKKNFGTFSHYIAGCVGVDVR
jgi:hypothetical protein